MIPFWDMTPCHLVSCFQIFYIETEGDPFFREAGKTLPLPNYVPSRPRRIFSCARMKTSRLA